MRSSKESYKIAQRFNTIAVIPEELSLVPAPLCSISQLLIQLASEDLMSSSDFPLTIQRFGVHSNKHINIHMNKNNL